MSHPFIFVPSAIRALALCLATASALATAAEPDRQSSEQFSTEVKLQVAYPYLKYLPEGYEADKDKRWPLIIFLHGAGERGENVQMLKKHGPPKLIAAGQNFPAIIISPQCAPKQIWNPHAVHALTMEIMRTHRVDASRVYLTGLSMGGFGTWETATEYPDTYAALMPICGGGGVRFVMADRIKHIPEWIFHGAKDPTVDPAFSKKMYDALLKAGAQVKMTVYPNALHDSWTATYDNPEVWAWLFAQHK